LIYSYQKLSGFRSINSGETFIGIPPVKNKIEFQLLSSELYHWHLRVPKKCEWQAGKKSNNFERFHLAPMGETLGATNCRDGCVLELETTFRPVTGEPLLLNGKVDEPPSSKVSVRLSNRQQFDLLDALISREKAQFSG
jgi:hypothetical protein